MIMVLISRFLLLIIIWCFMYWVRFLRIRVLNHTDLLWFCMVIIIIFSSLIESGIWDFERWNCNDLFVIKVSRGMILNGNFGPFLDHNLVCLVYGVTYFFEIWFQCGNWLIHMTVDHFQGRIWLIASFWAEHGSFSFGLTHPDYFFMPNSISSDVSVAFHISDLAAFELE